MHLQPFVVAFGAFFGSSVSPDDCSDGFSPQKPMLDMPAHSTASFPVVDLGYAKHRAIYNPNPELYKFQSVRYAAAPLGDLRFRAPQDPVQSQGEVENGKGRKECLQATVKWADNFDSEPCEDCECCEEEDEAGNCLTACSSQERIAKAPGQLLGGLSPGINLTNPKLFSEDCLFLDVYTPKSAFDGKEKKPVMVWIYGGAYIFGGKSLYFPGGLMDRAIIDDRGGMVYVALNYRMGAMGFAAGEGIDDADINAGLLDQRKALLWVREHIDKFGGDPDQVTIVGLSSGGGSVLHQITAYGGERQDEKLFHRAISFSGGWQPVTDRTLANHTFNTFMTKYNKVNTLAELRDPEKASEEQMMKANYDQIYAAPPGTFLYNPTAWGDFAPQSAAKLFRDGHFATDVDMILSHALDDGGQFAGAFKAHNTTVPEFLNYAFPNITKKERAWILENYESNFDPAADIGRIIGDATFRCHVTYASDAKHKQVYRQQWNTVKSDTHGGDLLYLFYQPLVPVQSVRSARILQDYVVTFVINGTPTTTVKSLNPVLFPQPAPYARHDVDGKVQFFDSGAWKVPVVRRGETELDPVCRGWQDLSCT